MMSIIAKFNFVDLQGENSITKVLAFATGRGPVFYHRYDLQSVL